MGLDPRPRVSESPGVGPGWLSLSRELGGTVPPEEIARIWVFPAVRRDDRDFGTAVILRRGAGDRVRVYTARFVRIARGRERGQCRVLIDEVAECPLDVIFEVLRGVQERMAESEPPVEISPSVWYGSP